MRFVLTCQAAWGGRKQKGEYFISCRYTAGPYKTETVKQSIRL